MTPGGRRGTVCLTFDNMGAALQVGRKERAAPDFDDPTLTVGFPAILAMLDDVGAKGTFFIEGWNALHHPDHVRQVAAAGHEIGVHGWVHEVFASLDAMDSERVIVDALAAFRNLGIFPTGFRAPGGRRSPSQADLLVRLGFDYDSSLELDDPADGAFEGPRQMINGLVNVPWNYPQIDNYHFAIARNDRAGGPLTPDQFADEWCGRIDQAGETGSLVTFIVHPAVTGIDEARTAALGQVLRHAIEHPSVDLLTACQVASLT